MRVIAKNGRQLCLYITEFPALAQVLGSPLKFVDTPHRIQGCIDFSHIQRDAGRADVDESRLDLPDFVDQIAHLILVIDFDLKDRVIANKEAAKVVSLLGHWRRRSPSEDLVLQCRFILPHLPHLPRAPSDTAHHEHEPTARGHFRTSRNSEPMVTMSLTLLDLATT